MQSAAQAGAEGRLDDDERQVLLRLARRALWAVVRHEAPPALEFGRQTDALREPRACFVTLTLSGQLRGCVGQLTATVALWKAVVTNAERAAVRDHRFPPLSEMEVDRVQIDISVLGPMRPLETRGPDELLSALRAGTDGVVLEVEGRVATFLPQVWQTWPDKVRFLDHLARKAGFEEGAWRLPGARVSVYEVESFEEERQGGKSADPTD